MLPNIRPFGIKSTPSGHLMVQETSTNDLVVYTAVGKEIVRQASAIKFEFPATHIRNPHCSGETDKVIWFSGSNELSIVDLHDLKMNEFKNFLPSMGAGKDAVPLRTILKDSGETIVCSFVLENNFGVAYKHKSIVEPHIYVLSELLPTCKL